MSDEQVKQFLTICSELLGRGAFQSSESASWCSWTTFSRLAEDAGYWTAGLPGVDELTDVGVRDGGTWGQPFLFEDIAHVIVPRQFYWEKTGDSGFVQGTRLQDIDLLSERLTAAGVEHRLTRLVLELKRY